MGFIVQSARLNTKLQVFRNTYLRTYQILSHGNLFIILWKLLSSNLELLAVWSIDCNDFSSEREETGNVKG